jgi:hypothetical protein
LKHDWQKFRNLPSKYRRISIADRSHARAGVKLYQIETKGDNVVFVHDFGLRKSGIQGTIFTVRRTSRFLQYGTSARLAAPQNCMIEPQYALPPLLAG